MPLALQGNLNSALPEGYVARGEMMLEHSNQLGAADQWGHALSMMPTWAPAYAGALCGEGYALLGEGRPDEAQACFEEWLSENPASPQRTDVKVAVADCYFSRGEYSDALARYATVNPIALSPGRVDDLTFRQAYCLMMLGESEEAAAMMRTLQSSPRLGDAARFYLGYLAYQQGNFEQAKTYFANIDRTKSPGNTVAYYEAQIAFAEGRYDEALARAKELIAHPVVEQFTPECYRIAGEALYNLGRSGEAAPYLWQYCADSPDPSPSAFYVLGVVEYEAGHWENAIKLLRQAIGTQTAMEQSAYLYLGQAYLKSGDSSAAMLAFENAYKSDYDRAVRETALYNYTVARMDGGRVPFGNSVGLLKGFLAEYPDSEYSTEVRRYMISGFMTDNDYESALQAIDEVKRPSADLQLQRQRVLLVLGAREYQAGKTAAAIDHLSQAAAMTSTDASLARQASLWLGDCYYAHGNYDAAAEAFEEYLAAAPATESANRALAFYGLGYARFAREKWREALTDFRDAAALMKSSHAGATANRALLADTYTRMADCRSYLGDYAGAEKDYVEAHALNPDAADYPLFQVAVMKGLQRNYKGKIDILDALLSTYPTSGLLPTALLEKAESQAYLGNISGAIATYRHLIDTYPGTAPGRQGYLQLAVTYINRGEREKGIITYRDVVQTFPTSEEARIAAEDLRGLYAADGRLDELVRWLNSVPNAPRFSDDEIEKAAFLAAENEYVKTGDATRVQSFVNTYPDSPSQPQALYYLAEAAWNRGDGAEAETAATLIVTRHPDAEVVEDALLLKGRAEEGQGKTQTAFDTYSTLESRASGAEMLRNARLGMLHTAVDLGRNADVVATADRLLASTASSSPDDAAEIKFARAMANASLGHAEAARTEWSELAQHPATPAGAKAAYYLGQSQLDAGQTDAARRTAEALIAADTPQAYWLARTYILYSDILRRQGATFEADEYLRSLRENYPGTETDIFQMISTRLN